MINFWTRVSPSALRITGAALFGLSAVSAVPAQADIRRVGLVSFERVDIEGDMSVEITASHRISGVIEGSRDAIEAISVEVADRTLRIRRRSEGPYGPVRADAGPVVIRITAQHLAGISVLGAAQVSVAGLRGEAVDAAIAGAGTLAITGIDARNLRARTHGSGTLTLSGRAASLIANVGGSSEMQAGDLAVGALNVRAVGTGVSRFAALRSAEVTAQGASGVLVTGNPRCILRNQGSGTVECGPRATARLPQAADR